MLLILLNRRQTSTSLMLESPRHKSSLLYRLALSLNVIGWFQTTWSEKSSVAKYPTGQQVITCGPQKNQTGAGKIHPLQTFFQIFWKNAVSRRKGAYTKSNTKCYRNLQVSFSLLEFLNPRQFFCINKNIVNETTFTFSRYMTEVATVCSTLLFY